MHQITVWLCVVPTFINYYTNLKDRTMIKKLKQSKFAKKALHIAFVGKRYFLAVKMHLSIVWRRWHDYEDEEGNLHKTYIDWVTAWTVAKGVWLD